MSGVQSAALVPHDLHHFEVIVLRCDVAIVFVGFVVVIVVVVALSVFISVEPGRHLEVGLAQPPACGCQALLSSYIRATIGAVFICRIYGRTPPGQGCC